MPACPTPSVPAEGLSLNASFECEMRAAQAYHPLGGTTTLPCSHHVHDMDSDVHDMLTARAEIKVYQLTVWALYRPEF